MLYSTQIRWKNLKEIKLFNTLKFWTVCFFIIYLLLQFKFLFFLMEKLSTVSMLTII